MTLRVIIKNDGNNDGDTLIIKGMITKPHGCVCTGNPQDSVTVTKGKEITIFPPADHFDDYVALWFKGKH